METYRRKNLCICEHEGLDGQQQRLNPKEHGVHDSECID